MFSIPVPQAILMGISSAVVGGILGAVAFIPMQRLVMQPEINSVITPMIIIAIRSLSVYYNWSLPHFSGLKTDLTDK